MTLNLTRGGLVPAKLTNLATNDEVKFMFNPYEYTISKTNTWEKKTVIGENVPHVTFQQGGAQTLKLTLYFDTLEDAADVRWYTIPLWKMMMIDTQAENPNSGKGAPPAVAFEWGRLYFKAIMTDLSESFTLFLSDGTPVRSKVDVSLEQLLDTAAQPPQVSAPSGAASQRVATVIQGSRIDYIAGLVAGNAAAQRAIAAANNINNPLKLKNGKKIKPK